MGLIIKIAWRNVLRHKGKSIIIGAILFFSAFLMTLGNGVISGLDRGLERNIINGFLGDIVIVSDKEKSENVLIKMYGESLSSFSNYTAVKDFLAQRDYLKDYMPVGKNVVMVLNDEEGDAAYAYVLGVDLDEYRRFFPDAVKLLEGDFFDSRQSGVLFPTRQREDCYNMMNFWYVSPDGLVEENLSEDAKANRDTMIVKDNVIFMGMSEGDTTTDVRIPVRGVFKYKALNSMWGNFVLMDIESYRQCLGYFAASDLSVDIADDTRDLLAMEDENLDSMFSGEDFVVADTGSADLSDVDFTREEDTSLHTTVNHELGSYNMILVKLKDSRSLDSSLKRLNKELAESGLGMRAISWKKASGFIGSMAMLIKGALFLFVSFLFFVAIIIIVNTLSMAAIERTTEIGMMRAVGAYKSFISFMFVGETAVLAGVFGGAGIVTGMIAVRVLAAMHITTDNDMLQLLFGGDNFMPVLTTGDIFFGIGQLILVTVITVIYPLKLARAITPLEAIARD